MGRYFYLFDIAQVFHDLQKMCRFFFFFSELHSLSHGILNLSGLGYSMDLYLLRCTRLAKPQAQLASMHRKKKKSLVNASACKKEFNTPSFHFLFLFFISSGLTCCSVAQLYSGTIGYGQVQHSTQRAEVKRVRLLTRGHYSTIQTSAELHKVRQKQAKQVVFV